MARPTVKHPGFNIIARSPQGLLFMDTLLAMLGEHPSWQALEKMRDGSHLFLLEGPNGRGVLVEGPARAEGDRWVQQWGFRSQPASLASVLHVECTTHRWDPWLAAELSGDRSLLDGPVKRRYAVQKQRDLEVGGGNDRLRVLYLPESEAPTHLCGFALESLGEILERHEVSCEEEAPWPGAAEWSRERLIAEELPLAD